MVNCVLPVLHFDLLANGAVKDGEPLINQREGAIGIDLQNAKSQEHCQQHDFQTPVAHGQQFVQAESGGEDQEGKKLVKIAVVDHAECQHRHDGSERA